MKLRSLYFLFLIIALNANSQCYSVFKDMKLQPPAVPAGYKAVENECQYSLYYVTHVKINTSSTNVLYHLWNGSSWTTLKEVVFKGGMMKLMMWNNKLIAFGSVKSIDGLVAPLGKRIRFAEYKGDHWDSLPGGVFDSTDNKLNQAVGTKTGLYYNYTYDSSGYRLGNLYSYDSSLHKFTKRLNYKGSYNPPAIMGGGERLLIINVILINGKRTSEFCSLLGDSILLNNIYVIGGSGLSIDGTNDHIYAISAGIGLKYPPVYEFNDTLVSYTETAEFNNGGDFLVNNGLVVYRNSGPGKSAYFSILCKGENKWRTMTLSGTFDYLYSSNEGYFIQDISSGKVSELWPGALIQGQVYIDQNSDCKYDQGKDSLLKFHRIEAASDFFKSVKYSDINGKYYFVVPVDVITLKGQKVNTSCPLDSVSVLDKDSIYNWDIPVQESTLYDIKLTSPASKTIRWNSLGSYQVSIENLGLPFDSAWFEFKLDKRLKLLPQKDSGIISINNNIIKGRIKHMGYYDKKIITIKFLVDTFTLKPNSVLCNTFSAHLFRTEADLDNNTDSFCQMVVYSRDPNHKECDKDSIPPALSSLLEYRIDFQNEGKADAIDVTLVDQLSGLLNASSVSDVESSHPFSMNIEGSTMRVDFRNINLKPKDSSEAESKGYFKFRVATLLGLTQNDNIFNTASIYFDLNKALQTNTSQVTVRKVILPNNAVSNIHQQTELLVHPNPANALVNIAFESPQDIFIFSLTGQLMYTEKAVLKAAIDIAAWPTGLYFVRSTRGNGTFIKVE